LNPQGALCLKRKRTALVSDLVYNLLKEVER